MQRIKWWCSFFLSAFQLKIKIRILENSDFNDIRKQYLQKYCKKKILDFPQANNLLKKWMIEGRNFAAIRNGMDETSFYIKLQRDRLFNTKTAVNEAMAADFDYDIKLMEQYRKLLNETYRSADLCGVWSNIIMEEHELKKLPEQVVLTDIDFFTKYDYEGCWIQQLKGRKVLIVSPFVDTMREQYKKRQLLHKSPDVLPEFEMHTVKAVWWYDGGRDKRFQSWNDALYYMLGQCMKQDFDIALISCGTLSAPLAVKLKDKGKQAIQVGGMLQVLFGIKGKRWDEYPGLYNNYWVKLPEDTKVGNTDVLDHVEGGAYW